LTLPNFTEDGIGALYRQHTEATGQLFEDSAIAKACLWSEGQPWLVNALADTVIVDQLKNDFSVTVTAEHIDNAAETLIRRRDAHIDSLLERLREPRIRRVIEPIILGDDYWDDQVLDDDIQYAIDLGLIKRADGSAEPANPIYGEVIIRTLTKRLQEKLNKSLANRWIDEEKVDITTLLKSFQQFWRENSEFLAHPFGYNEATPHLVCFAYLQRALNGGVETIHREYALGRRRLDINIKYKGISYPIEFKLKPREKFSTLKRLAALEQLSDYMDKLGANEGWLLFFDREPNKSWEDKFFNNTEIYNDKTIHVFGC
jgi:hypothetical protein